MGVAGVCLLLFTVLHPRLRREAGSDGSGGEVVAPHISE
jgi:hypothetical protein